MNPIDEDEADRVREIDTIENYMFRKKATYERAVTEASISAVDERHSQEEDDQSFKSFLEEQNEEPEVSRQEQEKGEQLPPQVEPLPEDEGDIDDAAINVADAKPKE